MYARDERKKKEASDGEEEQCINLLEGKWRSCQEFTHDALGVREGNNDEHVVCTDAAATVMIVLEGDDRSKILARGAKWRADGKETSARR